MKQLFSLPAGLVRKEFVDELPKLYFSYAKKSALEHIAKAASVLHVLLPQWPHKELQQNDCMGILAWWLGAWWQCEMNSLVCEGCVLQESFDWNTSSRCPTISLLLRLTESNLAFCLLSCSPVVCSLSYDLFLGSFCAFHSQH